MRTWLRCWAAFSPLLLVVAARMSHLQSIRSTSASVHRRISRSAHGDATSGPFWALLRCRPQVETKAVEVLLRSGARRVSRRLTEVEYIPRWAAKMANRWNTASFSTERDVLLSRSKMVVT
jgi:hypothetical protein